MEFASATEYRKHMRTIIDDFKLVEKIVRAKFPPESRVISELAFKAGGKKAPSAFDPWINTEEGDRMGRKAVENGSENLLRAIKREHPAIMQRLAQQGLTVAAG